MENVLATVSLDSLQSLDFADLQEEAREFARRSKGVGTVRLYDREWRRFVAWCSAKNQKPLPADPNVVTLYVTDLARTLSVASINVAVAAISQAHQVAGIDSPTHTSTFRNVWRGIRRTLGVAAKTQKTPTTTDVVKSMIEVMPEGLIGVRDHTILLFAFATAMRRSEIVDTDVSSVRFVERGLEVTVAKSKTDQEGVGHVIAVPFGNSERTCPVRALRRWLQASEITEGPLFRSVDRHGRLSDSRLDSGSVGRIVKRLAERTGRDPKQFGGHSTRAGFITSAATNGASERSIAEISNHRSVQVLRSYVRAATRFDDNAGAKLGL